MELMMRKFRGLPPVKYEVRKQEPKGIIVIDEPKPQVVKVVQKATKFKPTRKVKCFSEMNR
jgi:hypothetical protein